MKSLACADLSERTKECPFVAEGDTQEDIDEQMFDHAGKVHPEALENMTDEMKEGMVNLMHDKTKDVSDVGMETTESETATA